MPRLKVEIPEEDYWRRQVNCQSKCPVNTDARGYVRAIAAGQFDQAYLIARGPNPLASICGRICAAPCEEACRRSMLDESIFIRGLKRSAIEESDSAVLDPLEMIRKLKESAGNRNRGLNDLGGFMTDIDAGKFTKADGQSIGIIGSGPAGLAAAHDLALMGFTPVIYEMEPVAAGMLYLGVPAYRLPRELINGEVDVIKALGVKIETDCTIGEDLTFPELRKRHDAVIIAVGCKRPRKIPIPGVDGEGVYGGVDFLRQVALGLPHELGEKVVIIGGGNVAYDIARTALRRQQMDVAITAAREMKNRVVTLCCLERRDEMLADEVEILEGEEEGVSRLNGYGPQEILLEDGKAKGVVFNRIVSIFDDDGRFNPQYDKEDSITLEANTVLLAVGQVSDLSFLDEERDGVKIERLPVHDSETLETTAPGVYVAGDLATGPSLMINAIASGKHAARSIYKKLTGNKLEYGSQSSHCAIENYGREMGYEKLQRHETETMDAHERIRSVHAVVDMGLTREQAQKEASRCLECSNQTIFDGERCILCGGCAEVCPMVCLKLISIDDLEGTQPEYKELVEKLGERKESDVLSAIIKNEEKCIRCGLCVARCPVGAVTMEKFTFKEQIK